MSTSWCFEKGNQVILHLHVQPNASCNEIVGIHNGRLKIRVSAPPVDGKANVELLSFLKKKLKVSSRDLEIIRGVAAKTKDVSCLNVTIDQVVELLKRVE